MRDRFGFVTCDLNHAIFLCFHTQVSRMILVCLTSLNHQQREVKKKKWALQMPGNYTSTALNFNAYD